MFSNSSLDQRACRRERPIPLSRPPTKANNSKVSFLSMCDIFIDTCISEVKASQHQGPHTQALLSVEAPH
jgi:hypothetical protein